MVAIELEDIRIARTRIAPAMCGRLLWYVPICSGSRRLRPERYTSSWKICKSPARSKHAAPSKVKKLERWGARVLVEGEVWDDANRAALAALLAGKVRPFPA